VRPTIISTAPVFLYVAHVDALGLVERDGAVALHHLYLHRRHVLAQPHHRPAFACAPRADPHRFHAAGSRRAVVREKGRGGGGGRGAHRGGGDEGGFRYRGAVRGRGG
jgi:hypothetical protein